MKLVIVTGSRKWASYSAISDALDGSKPDVVMHGAASGADIMAGEWADHYSLPVLPMPAQWDLEGKGAGPARNQRMVDIALAMYRCGWEVEVLAFPLPDSVGTNDMIGRCRRADFKVVVHSVRTDTA